MRGDPLLKVKSGLRTSLWIGTIFLATIFSLAVVRAYFQFVVSPSFSILWFYALLAVVIGDGAVAIWYLAYRYLPRILRFAESMTDRVREAEYAPYGTRKQGLVLAFDNGLILTLSRNLIMFRLFLDHDGTSLHPTLREFPSLLRRYRRAKRTVRMRSRTADSSQGSELSRVLGLIGGRWAILALFERVTPETLNVSGGRWKADGTFFVPKWWQNGDAFRNALDDIEKLLEGLRRSQEP